MRADGRFHQVTLTCEKSHCLRTSEESIAYRVPLREEQKYMMVGLRWRFWYEFKCSLTLHSNASQGRKLNWWYPDLAGTHKLQMVVVKPDPREYGMSLRRNMLSTAGEAADRLILALLDAGGWLPSQPWMDNDLPQPCRRVPFRSVGNCRGFCFWLCFQILDLF